MNQSFEKSLAYANRMKVFNNQLRLLKDDNITSGKYKTNKEIGLPSKLFFKDEVKKYSFMWRDGGQFSTDKYNLNN